MSPRRVLAEHDSYELTEWQAYWKAENAQQQMRAEQQKKQRAAGR